MININKKGSESIFIKTYIYGRLKKIIILN